MNRELRFTSHKLAIDRASAFTAAYMLWRHDLALGKMGPLTALSPFSLSFLAQKKRELKELTVGLEAANDGLYSVLDGSTRDEWSANLDKAPNASNMPWPKAETKPTRITGGIPWNQSRLRRSEGLRANGFSWWMAASSPPATASRRSSARRRNTPLREAW